MFNHLINPLDGHVVTQHTYIDLLYFNEKDEKVLVSRIHYLYIKWDKLEVKI